VITARLRRHYGGAVLFREEDGRSLRGGVGGSPSERTWFARCRLDQIAGW